MVNIQRLFRLILCILVISIFGFYYWMQGQYVVPVLMYHNVSQKSAQPLLVIGRLFNLKIPMNNVTPVAFEKQMRFLKNYGYHVISLDDYLEGKKENRQFSHKTVVITFDDGYMDNYTNAYPILKKYHFPATIFLISDYVGHVPTVLTWDQVKEMSQNNISFGSHTRHHLYLPDISNDQMKDEIVESKRIIEEHIGKPVDYFAYPIGGFSEKVKAVVALAGYKAAFTTNRGYDRYDIDLYELNRVHINNTDQGFGFAGKISGFNFLFRKLRASN